MRQCLDDPYYGYTVSEGRSSIDYRSPKFSFISDDDVVLTRRRRTTPLMNGDQSNVHGRLEDPEAEMEQQRQEQLELKRQKEREQRQEEMQRKVHGPLLETSVQPSTMITTVTYSTDYSTSQTTSTPPSKAVNTTSDSKLDVHKSAATGSQPTNSTAEASAPHVWANRTIWSNVTSNKESDSSKNQTKVTELTAVTSPTEDEKSEADISISKFSEVTNTTLLRNNITKTVCDSHQYYNSTFVVDTDICKKYWVDMDNHPELKVNHLLSQSHRRAATVKLKFDFPFYGHKVRNITIATGGFLYTGEYVHSWLAATQYIAPLMANFDTRLSNASYVKYADNGTAFTVEWEKVVLQDKPQAGAFTFQVTLHKNGDIVFVYSVIPITIELIEDTMHPVKIGLSDAYIMDRTVFFVRRKTIYEYHRVNFNRQDIRNCTVIYLKALPTCLNTNNCRDCLTKVSEFDCKWCPELNKCSTGTFRSRQEWLLKGCDVHNVKEPNNCPAQITTYKGEQYDHDGHVHSEQSITANEMTAKQERPGTSPLESSRDNMNMSVSGIIGILTVIALVMGLAGWGAYAYRNPHSASGQMLIRYRPSQWSWRRGEARYTAATIHM